MSSHYTVDFSMDLRRDLSVVEEEVLRYLIEEGYSEKPIEFPSHNFFKNGLPKSPYWYSYRNFPAGPFISSIWERGQDAHGRYYGLCLRLPSLKLEDIYEDFLGSCVWLATLSDSSGFVGSVWKEEHRELHTLLFIYDSELYIDTNLEYDLRSVISGQPPKR